MNDADRYEVWISDPLGNRLDIVTKVISVNINRVVGEVGTIDVRLPDDFDERLLRLDGIIEVWRQPRGGRLKWAGVGFIRAWNFEEMASGERASRETASTGIDTIHITAYDGNYILDGAIVAYHAGSAQASKTAAADNMMKAVVRENRGALATDANRNLTSLGFTVEVDRSAGASISRGFSRKNVLRVCQDISETTRVDTPEIYFDTVPVLLDSDRVGWQFRTYENQRGIDRTGSGIVFGREWGNLELPSLEILHGEEANYIYAAGEDTGENRVTAEAYDTARIGASPWNRREKYVDSRGEGAASITANANQALSEGRPRKRFAGTILDTDQTAYGRDWDLGDVVPVTYRGQQYETMVRAVEILLTSEGQDIVRGRVEVIDE